MGRPRGSKNIYPSFTGNRYSVYLNGVSIYRLEVEIMDRSKLDKSSNHYVVPKGLTVPRLIAACVDYMISEDKLRYVLSDKYPRKKHKDF